MDQLLCRRGDPWHPRDLDQVLAERPDGFIGIVSVDHWRLEDMPAAIVDSGLVVTGGGAAYVQVLHDGVDPVLRQCENCGTLVGKPSLRQRMRVG